MGIKLIDANKLQTTTTYFGISDTPVEVVKKSVIDNAKTVEAVPFSVIEKIKAEIDKHKLPCCFKDDRGYTHFLPNVIKVDDVLEIIVGAVREVEK